MPFDPRTLALLLGEAQRGDGVLRVGFTGTRHLEESGREALLFTVRGLSEACQLAGLELEVIQGGCVGADTFVANAASLLAALFAPVTVHTVLPEDMSRVPPEWRSHCHTYETVTGPYRNRNKAIVKRARCLFGVADYPEEHGKSRRSGTWMTIRMGQEANIPTLVMIQHEEAEGA